MDATQQVRRIWQELQLPGIIDVHTHFMPKRVMDKVWQYFDSQGPLIGRNWPITYRTDEQERVHTLRRFGVRAFTSLVYPHKPQMAEWLNAWAAQFAVYTPDCLRTATFFPEPGAPGYVADAIAGGTRVFKAHLQVGGYDPNDPLLDEVWGALEAAGVPVIIHCGSGPVPGTHTGPDPVRRLLRRFPRLTLIIAHLGMPEYTEFLDLTEAHENVALDTTMALTGFIEEAMPFPAAQRPRLLDLGERILFGSDFPNIPYRYAEAMRALTDVEGANDAWLRNVFYDNAARLFGLEHSRSVSIGDGDRSV
ncbi:amidohydrolase family protein [Mycolicibacterium palauense]|uniref:amidohydrolase family protein n=1 Tax=Mycolicibacterium palauense TaxID=2034511 RepID=UPI000BFEB246|nr:amidohydrolase family protein [Mycolicibacterium palauense]